MLLCLIGATNVEVAVLVSPSTAQWHAQGHDKRDSLFMHMDGWVCGSDGYREWANKGLEVGVEISLEGDEPILIL
jgi:hypothetical protein